ncbi:hypothetical protein [Streptomyces canus]|uniref:TIGR04222 domain-containing membrane protein n=1 Tax=Streptomyces canus TaxID=58343 RepID=A0AAW8FKM8_9ACTN|nr:hypothetical protein [Streptomyces canus]MDQ0909840.1 hypothetical protein [Streptomyces canus]MDQ1069848.1 hypothetical protein [Streptomyces canus]
MSQPELLTVALAIAGSVYAVLGVLWWVRDHADRRAVARLDPARVEPYHAVATAGEDKDVDRAGAAVLLAAGLIRITQDGLAEVTESGAAGSAGAEVTGSGADPARASEHPIPATVLATLTGHREPRCLTWLHLEDEHSSRRDAFLRAEDAKWPRWPRREVDLLQTLALVATLPLATWCDAQLLYVLVASSGDADDIIAALFLGVLTWPVFALVLAGVVGYAWPERRDRFAEYCRGLLPHPAERDLDTGRREELERAWGYQPPRTADDDRVETWVDSGGAF